MPKTAPKPQLTAVTALNPWCWGASPGVDELASSEEKKLLPSALLQHWPVRPTERATWLCPARAA